MKKRPKILVVTSRYNEPRELVKSAWQELDKNNAISIRYNAAENDCQSSLIAKKKSSKAVE